MENKPMKRAWFFCGLVLSLGFTGCAPPDDFPVLKGPYLGQNPPGKTAEIFAPGIVSTGFVEQFAYFTPDGRELYYLLRGAPHTVTLFMKEVDGRWAKPRVAPFSGKYFAKFCLSPDGNTIVFDSNQPLDGEGPPLDTFHVWTVERINDGWGEPKLIESLIDAGAPSIASNRNLYFYLDREGERDILFSEYIDGAYSEPVNLGEAVNSEYNEVDPFIAPDESYLLFCSDRPEGLGLYVCFKEPDGSWTTARNMGEEVNISPDGSCCPSVSPDGKYLFFTSNRNIHPRYSEEPLTYEKKIRILSSPGNGSIDIYWVDAAVIQALKR
jgi:Tol biopolymer transport system component